MIDGKIEAKEILLKDLFSAKFLFQIPGYQRPFSWEKDNFDQLFEDIKDAMEYADLHRIEDNYFLGSIILQVKEEKPDGAGIYDVVDGQQRLTTLTILLAVLRDLVQVSEAKKFLQEKIYQMANVYENIPEKVRLLVREKDRDFFKKHILTIQGTESVTFLDNRLISESQINMVEAISTFSQKFFINDQLHNELLDRMIKFIFNNCVLVYVKTGSFTSAYRLFSILNDRGMPLSTADLLKSSNLGEVADNTAKERYQKKWEDVEEELGRDKFDELIGHIRTILVKDKAKKSIIAEYEEIIFKKNSRLRGKQFIEMIEEIADIYKEHLMNAHVRTRNPKLYNLMSIMRDYIPNSDWIPVYISFARKFTDENDIYTFLVKLEKLVATNWLLEITPTARIVEMNRLLQIIEIENDVTKILDDDLFDITQYEGDVVAAIDSPNFYKKKYCKYVLLRLDMLLSENHNIMKAYTGVITVEHVLPQNPSSEWSADFNDETRKFWTHRLGNLVLLSRMKNSSANNRSFDKKVKTYLSKGMTDFTITKELSKYNDWNPSTLEERHFALTKVLADFWM
ncbi:DUF262 domain-containing HNH endonuclease family protein [Paenibacillus chondroitinus]|uniref:DUF262 domain-containing HNH endonuclease family protein n=1 Tax=Paenibacillus chondroitinus TaxID=59842 RepID=A0ABU6DK09_9BACL|nr:MULTISPECIES: DUF262 domain-containing protein [Paenibacillus]MCY9658484.1 DUF262 domain-containing HNH endonuclease family protein [Paenibacillus anseongense]MEB4797196.1 DUF262 domain-containing HNH endonuclease family protein [Paenibacillus chondroitinus]